MTCTNVSTHVSPRHPWDYCNCADKCRGERLMYLELIVMLLTELKEGSNYMWKICASSSTPGIGSDSASTHSCCLLFLMCS